MKIGYLHNLPLEYYPPATNFLDIAGSLKDVSVHAYSTTNRKDRATYSNVFVEITRRSSPNPSASSLWRLLVAMWWHVTTAISLWKTKPDIVFYVEPHSAIAAWIYFKLFRGNARLFIHHHELYEQVNFSRPGMRLPKLGRKLERSDLFQRAVWISQTNKDRIRLAQAELQDFTMGDWHILPNYPCRDWGRTSVLKEINHHRPLRLVYVGSASFRDTYIREIVEWVANSPESFSLHIVGYNVASEVWAWLDSKAFSNVSCNDRGCDYERLPNTLKQADVGLVLYKGTTSNFVYNVPNKVIEYLRCGLEVWYPKEMKSIRTFGDEVLAPLTELDFTSLNNTQVAELHSRHNSDFDFQNFTAEKAFAPLFDEMSITEDKLSE